MRAALLLRGAEHRVSDAVSFIRSRYADAASLEASRVFASVDLLDAPRSEVQTFMKVGFFPWNEAHFELSEALNHALSGAYKAVYDNCRRALELVAVGIYFQQAHVLEADARAWVKSDSGTPFFGKTIRELVKSSRFEQLDKSIGWTKAVMQFYWQICDTVHIKGERHSSKVVQPSHRYVNSIPIREFDARALTTVLDLFVLTCRHIATLLAAENPVLLVGLDLSGKFGLNPPMSGYFEAGQAARLNDLILPEAKPIFAALISEDDEVQSAVQWVNGLADVSEEELKEQIAFHEKLYGGIR